MKAAELYSYLDKDFITKDMKDDWARFMEEIEDYLSVNFKERSMGLVCDFTDEINKVYSAVFPTEEVMRKIIEDGAKEAMLFLHHPSIWDSRRVKSFYQMDRLLLERFKENKISIYNLHVPLDDFGKYSTSKTLADVLDINIEKPFMKYNGALNGVIGRTKCRTVEELNNKFSEVLGFSTVLYLYGNNDIENGRVAIVAGGGNTKETIEEMVKENVKVLITGISTNKGRFSEIHEIEQKSGISILGGTHYSTEKFACQKMCGYFEEIGLPAVFIDGEPIYEDM